MPALNFPLRTIAEELGFTEGPVVHDGAVYLCDIHGGRVLKLAGGGTTVVASTGGGPNGLAIGPDGALYLADNGGAMRWERGEGTIVSHGFEPEGYDTRIERIDLETGARTRILDRIGGERFEAIDDLVFDGSHGFWFTDLGRAERNPRRSGGVYWTSADGRDCRQIAYPLEGGANGIGLSPDGTTLYATEYRTGRLWAWDVEAPGEIRAQVGHADGGRLLWQADEGLLADSIGMAPSGNIVIATQPSGVFSVISPEGELLGEVETGDRFPTNICFDPARPGRALATLATTGSLVEIDWDEAAFAR